MTCNIPRPSPQALFDQYKNMFSVSVLGGSPIVPESNEWYAVALNYAAAEEFYAISEQQWRERDPRYACCDNLVAMAEADGVVAKPASYAQGYIIVAGIAGSAIPSQIEVIASNGRSYRTVGTLPQKVPASGAFTARVQDTEAGSAGNAAGGVTANLSTGVTGLTKAVTVCGGSFCGGAAAESCEALRTRYIARKQYQPRATQAWAIAKLLEWPCVTRVIPRAGSCCACDNGCGGNCECNKCGNGLDFYVMFDNAFECGIAPVNITAEIQSWMFGDVQGFGQGQVEIGVCGSVANAKPFLVDISIDIEGCPTTTQIAEIRNQIADFFKTVSPSVPLRAKQLDLLVANVIGAEINSDVTITPVTPNPQEVYISTCGDLEPECDYLPCLRNVTFTSPQGAAGGGNC